MTATNPFPLAAIDATGSEIRQLIAAVFAATPFPQGTDDVTGGFGAVGDSYKVTGSGAAVSVAQGIAVVRGTEASLQHAYVVGNTAPVSISSIPTAATQRYDLVVVSVRDAEYSGGNNDAPITRVAGTASTSPVDPSVPENTLVLARLRVSTGGVYQIDDLRPRATAQGGEHICTSTTRPAWAIFGQRILETDTGEHLVYYGTTTGWQKEWNTAWGRLGRVTSGAAGDQWITAAATEEIVGGAITVEDVPANRELVVKFRARIGLVAGATNPRVIFTHTGGLLNAEPESFVQDALTDLDFVDLELNADTATTGAPADYTVTVRASNSGGVNTFKFANTVAKSSIEVHDCGPAGSPV